MSATRQTNSLNQLESSHEVQTPTKPRHSRKNLCITWHLAFELSMIPEDVRKHIYPDILKIHFVSLMSTLEWKMQL